MLSEVSESVMGAAVVRAYGLDDTIHDRVTGAIGRRYDAEVKAHLRAATLWPMSSVFYALTLAVVVAVGAIFGPEWGLTFGTATAFLFLGDVFLSVFEDLPEIYAETQTAIAGWRKILAVLDLPVEIEEPAEGVRLPTHGALDVRVQQMSFGYRGGPAVLSDIEVAIPAGAHIAIVGETGSGKTTFAKLLTRLADPREGTIAIGGVDLRRRGAGVPPGRDPHGAPGRVPVRLERAGQREGRSRGRDRSRGRGRVRGTRPRSLGARRCRTGWTPAPASAASNSRSANAS